MLRLCLCQFAFVMFATGAEPTQTKAATTPNRLAKSSSPYLLQHANNPVDWYPWGPEAFAKAKKDGKLIFLSIGYSACHWCHVMEKESFSDAEIAKPLNEHFVCIKVDREERPDIDEVYLAALQATGVNGGWPLTLFLTPEGKPIFGGTYFPPEDKKSGDSTIPGLKCVLKKVLDLHRDKKAELYAQADRIAEMTSEQLNLGLRGVAIVPLEAKLVSDAVSQFVFDPSYGGLARKSNGYRGTKFPRVPALQFIQQQAVKPGQEALAGLLALSLDNMACGGLYDHLGGGFHRYSTERTWTVPHFEKMLYDQAQMVELYAEAVRVKPNADYERIIRETLTFVERELMSSEGYFYSALDADSDGKEGEFYIWTEAQLDEVLGTSADAKLFKSLYAGDGKNFESTHIILRTSQPLAKLLLTLGTKDQEQSKKLAALKQKLFHVRGKRNRPFHDTKMITAWNGQAVAAFARAGQILKDERYLEVARKAADFLRRTMRGKDGKLMRIYAAAPGEIPRSQGLGFLEDYAATIHGLLVLHEATGEKTWLTTARDLQAIQDKDFTDEQGGYFNTSKESEVLFARGRDLYDGAQPSANGMALRNLSRFWCLTHEVEFKKLFERGLKRFAGMLKTQPMSVPLALFVLDAQLTSTANVKPIQHSPTATKPRSSADVVSASAKIGKSVDGVQPVEITMTIAEDWHISANTVDNELLAESATQLEVFADDKPLSVTMLKFPVGEKITDKSTGDHNIYTGEVCVRFHVAEKDVLAAKSVQIQLKILACNDKNCLAPATITTKLK